MLKFALLCLLLVTRCASAPPVEETLWGPAQTLGEAEQGAGPALWVQDSMVTTTWIGADERGVHQDARLVSGTVMNDVVTLPLPPVHPHEQQLLPALNGKHHLLWLDADADGEQRLYAALLTDDLSIDRGPTPVSDQLTLRYSATALGDGSVLVVWSGGLLAESNLYLQRIDARGLPQQATLLHRDADWPAMARDNAGMVHLFWLRATDHSLHYSRIVDQSVNETIPISPGVQWAFGDRLHHVYAALDQTHVYLFWNITPADGDTQTWMLSGAGDDLTWQTPRRLGVEIFEGDFQTGLNSGQVTAARSGSRWLRWAAPAPGQFDVLPVAARTDDDLSITYFQGGSITGFQTIVSSTALVGPPQLRIDRERHLYLTWAAPLESGTAALRLTTTRR